MSPVPRSMQATTRSAVARVARRRVARPNGWWGVALLVATEATLFGTLIASYFYLRFQADQWPPLPIKPPAMALPLALTGALVVTVVPMLVAARAAMRGRLRAVRALLVLATLAQAGYLALQVVSYADDLRTFSPRDSSYGSVYFTLLAVDHLHVALGILANLALLARLTGGLTNYREIGVRVLGLYWAFVALASVLVVLTQVSPSL